MRGNLDLGLVSWHTFDPIELGTEFLEPRRIEVQRPTWQLRASCRGVGPDVFFPSRGESSAAAREFCAGCPVSAPCLEYAIANDCRGWWGGTSERDRVRLVRQRRREAA
ncbi:MAG: WhiB family transcriptional regulator [Ilumatobacteraceae bacterium]